VQALRIAFLVLLLANGMIFLWGVGQGQPEGREPARLTQQLAPEKLRIVALETLQPVAAPALSE
jgi:hypothetical protein